MIIEPIEILKGHTQKLSIAPWENNGRVLVSVTPLYLDPDSGEYHRRKGGFAVSPSECRELSAALVETAAAIDASPPEPQPTKADRDSSRWPRNANRDERR